MEYFRQIKKAVRCSHCGLEIIMGDKEIQIEGRPFDYFCSEHCAAHEIKYLAAPDYHKKYPCKICARRKRRGNLF
jgi:hypothetical protein